MKFVLTPFRRSVRPLWLQFTSRSLPAHVALLTLVALVPAQAAFNAPYPYNNNISSATNSYVDFDDNNCLSTVNSLGGSVTQNGAGLTLFGGGSISNSNAGPNYPSFSCQMNFVWQGTAFGTVGTTATVGANVVFTPTNVAAFACTLTVFANGTQVGSYNCVPSSGSSFNLSGQTFTIPAALTTWKVVMATTPSLNSGAPSTFSVSIPGGSSIDLGTVVPSTGVISTPTLSPAALGATGIMLILLAGYATLRHAKDGGFPVNRS